MTGIRDQPTPDSTPCGRLPRCSRSRSQSFLQASTSSGVPHDACASIHGSHNLSPAQPPLLVGRDNEIKSSARRSTEPRRSRSAPCPDFLPSTGAAPPSGGPGAEVSITGSDGGDVDFALPTRGNSWMSTWPHTPSPSPTTTAPERPRPPQGWRTTRCKGHCRRPHLLAQ